MSDYFSTVRQELADAVERRAHLRWYRRLRVPHGRPLALVLAALVVAAPAVAAVSGWFSPGQPDATGPVSAGTLFGVVKPGATRMLPIRIADPQGGPPWGLRLVRTTRGSTCVQLGRVQDGRLGSLGIADAWDNDHRFHQIPPNARAQECGSTDATGHGFVNRGILGESESANVIGDWVTGPQASGCRLPVSGGSSSLPACPSGANRIIFFGLLGPDAASITYRKPGGGLATQDTVAGVGAYLLVFPYNAATCDEYDRAAGAEVSCNGESEGNASPVVPGAITTVTYTHGRTCSLTQPAGLEAAYRAFNRVVVATLGRPKVDSTTTGRPSINANWRAAYQRLLARFLAREHLTLAQFRRELGPGGPQCPAVGWVAFKAPKITRAQIASPIYVRELPIGVYGCPNRLRLPDGCAGVTARPSRELPVEWSFKARLPVTHDHSWYEWSLQYPSGCASGGESFATYSNIHAGQILRYSTFLGTRCRGTYQLIAGFMAQAPQGQSSANGGGGTPGHDGSIVVGHASFTLG